MRLSSAAVCSSRFLIGVQTSKEMDTKRGARHLVESHFVGTTFGRIQHLVDVTVRRV